MNGTKQSVSGSTSTENFEGAATQIEGDSTKKSSFTTTEQVENIAKEIAKSVAEEEVKDLREALEKKLDDKQRNIIETLAIFISFFTFASINISIFSKLQNLSEAIWFMILMACVLIVVVSALFSIISININRCIGIIILCVFSLLIFIILFKKDLTFMPYKTQIQCIKDCRLN